VFIPEQGADQKEAQELATEATIEDLPAALVLCITVYICYFTTLNVCRFVLCT
jgi:hypothetical protein